MNAIIKKFHPSANDLQAVNTTVSCLSDGCSSIFNSDSNLQLHMAKTHRREGLPKLGNVQRYYYCPELSCIYNLKTEKPSSFSTFKLLKQHYLKVHGERNYYCKKCNKGFSLASAKKAHVSYCGVSFKCSECNSAYSSYEALLTHSRRKQHKVAAKTFFKPTAVEAQSRCIVLAEGTELVTLPHCSSVVGLIKVSPMCTDKSSQTDVYGFCNRNKSKRAQVTKKKPGFKQSQTSFKQTLAKIHTVDNQQLDKPNITQTSTATHNSINTDTSDLDTLLNPESFPNFDTETQTEFIFNDVLFSSIHTQTLLGRSVESQTVAGNLITAHTETQTDVDFSMLLEDINS